MSRLHSILNFVLCFMRHPLLCLHYILKAPYRIQAGLFSKQIQPFNSNDLSVEIEPDKTQNPFKTFVHANHTGEGIIKTDHYLDIYHRFLADKIGKNINILEIGVFSGGSLKMWRKIFGPESNIYGVDIEPTCKRFEGEKTRIFIGDQQDKKFWKNILTDIQPLDIIIDDGGHKASQQIATFEATFEKLKPGGVYICEDIPGENNRFLSYIQGLSCELYECRQILSPSKENNESIAHQAGHIQRMIRSIHFSAFAIIIEKNLSAVERFDTRPAGNQWLSFELLRK